MCIRDSLDAVRFYIVEAVDELLVGLFQRIVRIDFVEAGSVDEAEHCLLYTS